VNHGTGSSIPQEEDRRSSPVDALREERRDSAWRKTSRKIHEGVRSLRRSKRWTRQTDKSLSIARPPDASVETVMPENPGELGGHQGRRSDPDYASEALVLTLDEES
jgi:hypothetical protein